jgi:hypothetical protein
MILVIVLLAMWPFHAKKPAVKTTAETEAFYAEKAGGCGKEGDLYFFTGPDKVVGFSSISCGRAYHNWYFTPVPPPVMMNES